MVKFPMREKDWEDAIRIVDEEYKNKVVRGSAQWWSLVLGVYKRMQGRKMLRRLKRAKILRKQQIDLSSILALIITPQFPISIDQLLLDLPAPPVIAPIENLSSHYQRLVPHVSMLPPAQNPPIIFVPLSAEEIISLQHGSEIPLAKVEGFPEWVETFIKAWYLAILCGILDGSLVPQGEAGLKWVLQLTANPVLRAYLNTRLKESLENLDAECKKWRHLRLLDGLSLQHRFGSFRQNNVTMGVFLKPSTIGRVWCVRLHNLDRPLFPNEFTPMVAFQWWLGLMQSLLPCQYLEEGSEVGWAPIIGGTLSQDDIGAVVVFKGFVHTNPITRAIEVDFDTNFDLVLEVAKKLIKG